MTNTAKHEAWTLARDTGVAQTGAGWIMAFAARAAAFVTSPR